MYKKLQSQLIRKVVALFIYRYIYHWLSVGHIIHGLLHLIVAIKRNESLKNLVCVCVCAAIQNQTEEKKKLKSNSKELNATSTWQSTNWTTMNMMDWFGCICVIQPIQTSVTIIKLKRFKQFNRNINLF